MLKNCTLLSGKSLRLKLDIKKYYKLLRDRCGENGYNYIDITDYTMGEDGLIDTYYTRKENEFYGNLDHHLDCNKTNTLWQREIEKIIRF